MEFFAKDVFEKTAYTDFILSFSPMLDFLTNLHAQNLARSPTCRLVRESSVTAETAKKTARDLISPKEKDSSRISAATHTYGAHAFYASLVYIEDSEILQVFSLVCNGYAASFYRDMDGVPVGALVIKTI